MPERDHQDRRRRLRTVGGAVLRVIAVWAVGTVTMLILAGALPDFRLQSEDGDSATTIAITAAAGAGVFGLLSAVVWPVVVRALLLVPAYVLGLLAFFINGTLLWVALSLIPAGRGQVEPETAVVVAAVMSAASSAASTALAVRDDGAYRRRLARLAYRRMDREELAKACDGPGTVILQLDGIGHDVLLAALQPRECGTGVKRGTVPPLMETVAGWHGDTHRLAEWRTDWSSQTGASQLGILHGCNADVPAFRWHEKESGQVMVCNRPTSAAELQARAARRAGHTGLLGRDGASRGNLFTGGAREVALVLSVAARRGRDNRSRAGYFAYFSDPANFSRTFASFVAEVFREVGQSLMTRVRREKPRVGRGGLYPFIRAFATVVQRDVVVAAVLGDMLAGRSAVYADLVAYDEVAHYAGPYHRNTHQVLRRIDAQIRMIAKVAEYAPREYRIVLLSDHGQSAGPTFADHYGLTLQDLVRAGCGLPVSRKARKSKSGAEARAAARAALRRPEEAEEPGSAERGRAAGPIVLGSGNLGLISFPDVPGQVSREELDRRHPALLRTLAEHAGVGFLLVRSEEYGPVVLGRNCSEHHLESGKVIGDDPLAPFGPGAVDAVRRTAGFTNTPDIMVNSAYDEKTGMIHAFEDQVGSHGGLGGDQSRPFLCWPRELTPPSEGEEIVGAEQVHAILEGWLGLERPGLGGEPVEGEPEGADYPRSTAAR
ncbi:phage holin family protein [Streptomyces boninensis]|uniref:phage holin family protein n=1 Tax=Streptomyces boninensis TaxID=2039455 RepID=UPI003B228A9F